MSETGIHNSEQAFGSSEQLYQAAKRVLPGGVNSPVRAFGAVGGTPRFINRAQGAYLEDVDGKRYIDCMCSWGAILLEHAHPAVVLAIAEAATNGASFGAPHENETILAQEIIGRIPGLEVLRFVNSGTEACMSALRLARAASGRELTIKFEGCYHGHIDALLSKAGSGVATFSLPGSAGVPQAVTANTIVLPFNLIEPLREAFDKHGDKIGPVILEAVAGNQGLIPASPEFLGELRRLTRDHGSILIIDEVMTGFRASPLGASKLYDLTPDLYCFGKVIGGGLPVGAYGGKEEYMRMISPDGPVYQAGTLSGNPIGMAAGLATMQRLTPEFFEQIEVRSAALEKGLRAILAKKGMSSCVNRRGSMISLFFGIEKVENSEDTKQVDRETFGKFFHHMLDQGVYLPPSALESWFLCGAHGEDEIGRILEATEISLAKL